MGHQLRGQCPSSSQDGGGAGGLSPWDPYLRPSRHYRQVSGMMAEVVMMFVCMCVQVILMPVRGLVLAVLGPS